MGRTSRVRAAVRLTEERARLRALRDRGAGGRGSWRSAARASARAGGGLQGPRLLGAGAVLLFFGGGLRAARLRVLPTTRLGLRAQVAGHLVLCALAAFALPVALRGAPDAAAPTSSLLLALVALILRRLVILWVARRRGMAGSRLHVRLVALFSLVAVTPTIIVALFSVILFDFGLQRGATRRLLVRLASDGGLQGMELCVAIVELLL